MAKKVAVTDSPADLKPAETQEFHDLFAKLAKTRNFEERKCIKAELAKLTFDS